MAFANQLYLLLWKNYTLKKRKPLIFMAELTVPLVLFLILVIIRQHRPPDEASIASWAPLAMPSAGIVPLLQSFCPHRGYKKNGYLAFPGSKIELVIKDVADLANTPLFDAIQGLKKFEEDFEDFQKNPSFSNIRNIKDIKFSDLLKKDSDFVEYLERNLSMSSQMAEGFMNATFNGSEISSILLERKDGFVKQYLQQIVSKKAPTFSNLRRLQQSTILQTMFDPTSLLFGPTWLGALASVANVPGLSIGKPNLNSLEEVFKDIFLNQSEIRYLSCDQEVFNQLITLSTEYKNRHETHVEKDQLQEFLCNLTNAQDASLAGELQRAINWTAVLTQFHTDGPSIEMYEKKAKVIRDDMMKFLELEDAFGKLIKLSKDLNVNVTEISNALNNSQSEEFTQNAIKLWKILSPILCGEKNSAWEGRSIEQSMMDFMAGLKGDYESHYAFEFMMYVLTHDAMVLYAPNGTEADQVMEKAGHILKVIKDTKRLAQKWLELSAKLDLFLTKNQTQVWLKRLLKSINDFPFMFDPHLSDVTEGSPLYETLPKNIQELIHQYNGSIFKEIARLQQQRKAGVTDTFNNVTKDDVIDYLRRKNATEWLQVETVRENLKKGIEMMIAKPNNKSTEITHKDIQLLTELDKIDYMAEGWQAVLKPMKLDLFYGFPNETMLNRYIQNRTRSNSGKTQFLSAVLFDNIEKNGRLPKHLHYRIRMDSRIMFPTANIREPFWRPGPLAGNSKYYYFGFAWMQDSLERAMIELMTGRNVSQPGLYIQEIPYPCYLGDNFLFMIQYIMPLCVVISFIYSVAILVQSIVYEKEQRLKEVMKMMGLSNTVHWAAWFITSIVGMLTIVILLTIVLKTGHILPNSNSYIIFVFLTLAAIATIMFCFLISIFFSKAKLAAACGGIIYFVTYMPYIFISIQEGGSNHIDVSSNFKTVASLFSTTAFGLGARYFALFEQNGVGLQWSNLSMSPLEGDDFNMRKVFTMLLADTFIYAILVWYIESIHPGTYGIPRPWYFPFQLSYWFGPQASLDCEMDCFKKSYKMAGNSEQNTAALLAVETEPTHLKLGVAIKNLLKIYKKGSQPAIDHLSLNLYENQITSFLGHNGAGKTTTMSLLTGLFPSTSGTAYIYGKDIHTDMDSVRKSLGLCPQHNILYDRLTVEESLWFYARLKGMSDKKQVKYEIEKVLDDVGLSEKSNSFVDTLSGGMKRKLSVAIAFVGGSRTVILDEPTAGVDPYARRAIWELLEKYKDGRTILLSTHFMDEADILGDRIAIISHGKLRCVGSSLFLKTKFGDGYHLTLDKEPESRVAANSITKFIKAYASNAQMICETKYEVSYILPDKGKGKKDVLKDLFASLEERKEELGIKSFGLQDTTLEEVFLKVTEATVCEEEDNELTANVNMETIPPTSPSTISTTSSEIPMMETSSLSGTVSTGEEERMAPLFESITEPLIQSRQDYDLYHERLSSFDLNFNPDLGNARTPLRTNDMTFALTRGDINSPEHVKKVSSHKRIPSGTSKIQTIGSESWSYHVGTSSKINRNIERWQQFYALILKRFHHTKRNIKSLLTHIFLPGIFISIAMTVALSQPKANTYPKLVLSPTMFHPPPYHIPFSNSNPSSNISRKMEESLYLPSGISADCVLKNPNSTLREDFTYRYLRENLKELFDPFCYQQVGRKFNTELPEPISKSEQNFNISLTCNCTKNYQYKCDDGIEGNPETFNTVTRDTLHNIENRDFWTYLLQTSNSFKRRRYGALTFGDEQDVVPESVTQSKFSDIQKLYAKETARVWFNNKGFHAMPTYINAMDNALLRAMLPPEKGNPAAYGITAASHPLNITHNVLDINAIRQGTDAVIAIFVIIAMSFVPASFVVFLVMERTTKAKHIQFVSGLSPILYWFTNFVWDFFNYLIPAMPCILIFYLFDVPAYASSTNLPAVCALFVCYGWSITPMMYPASFLFREASTAFVVLILLNLFLGITCTITVSILQLFSSDPSLKIAYEIATQVCLIFPTYCLGRGLMDLAFTELLNQLYMEIGSLDKIRSPFEWELVTRSLVYMVTEGFIFFIITLLIEHFSTRSKRTVIIMDSALQNEDIDVSNERERVLSGGADDDVMRIENLTKIYNSRKTGKHLAVDRLCVGITRGECFGLLGVNGAGKTTTFKMLTGDIPPTAGDAYVENKSISHKPLSVHQKIGYCPQFDALFDHLTAKEHLYFYARLKGIPEHEISRIANWLIKKMALTRYANKPSIMYSGGNKRKLSAAIALLGNPSVIFMDEPTTGMDPGARRFLWNVILSIVKEGTKSVVLTSHSMEECEALCTRLAIMVNGKFKCLGSTQHLKDRFGDGYIVVIRIKGSLPNMEPIKNFMEETFENCIMKECHNNLVQYQIPSSSECNLSQIFSTMEEITERFDIEDYSVRQTSLDNVFVNFARNQRESQQANDNPSKNKENRFKKLRSRYQKLKEEFVDENDGSRETQLSTFPSSPERNREIHDEDTGEIIGQIGMDEDEILLDEMDLLSSTNVRDIV
ncbi:ATP-binding cassette sub-family A member 2-like [Clytia hemisphaerica]|uniref:ABC transporter domain-containing protein n=1 Tax=Clytia hemisphaerica TaxID=252671 RepID=A0A7M5V0E8_9CNID